MKPETISDAVTNISEQYIERAADYTATKKSKKTVWVKWCAMAACLALLLCAGIFLQQKDNRVSVSIGGIDRSYKSIGVISQDTAILWPLEYMTTAERYGTVTFNNKEYSCRGGKIEKSLVGDKIGVCRAVGNDEPVEFDAYQIGGISPSLLLAAVMDNELYVFGSTQYSPPSDFGELLDGYSLLKNLRLERFTRYKGFDEQGHFALGDDSFIWQALESCRSAKYIEDEGWSEDRREYLSFTATSQTLGVYKRTFSITADGYIRTNIFDYAYAFDIGEEAAGKIINYALDNSSKVEAEPYKQSLVGRITEIADGYILVDDSVLCSDKKDGMTFKVPADDLKISRYIDMGLIAEGDIISVDFDGEIDTARDNTVGGAYSINKVTLTHDGITVTE